MPPVADRLTERSFERLLARLGPDRDAAGREYEAIRHKLVGFFDRRGVPAADVLADETLDRVARRLDQGDVIEKVRPFCFGVARRVLLEWQKQRTRETAALGAAPELQSRDEASADAETSVACLERCLDELPPASRALIVGYYQGPGRVHLEGRKLLASRLGLSTMALKSRAHRIRVELEGCLRRCLDRPVTSDHPAPPPVEGGKR